MSFHSTRQRSTWKCRDCGEFHKVSKVEAIRASAPRCLACGGMLERSGRVISAERQKAIEWIDSHRTPKGGFSNESFRKMGVKPKKGWRQRLISKLCAEGVPKHRPKIKHPVKYGMKPGYSVHNCPHCDQEFKLPPRSDEQDERFLWRQSKNIGIDCRCGKTLQVHVSLSKQAEYELLERSG